MSRASELLLQIGPELEVSHIEEVRNANGKRVCDISTDHREVIIVQKGYITRITANPDGTLCIENLPQVA